MGRPRFHTVIIAGIITGATQYSRPILRVNRDFDTPSRVMM
jgi:hypothetical protein